MSAGRHNLIGAANVLGASSDYDRDYQLVLASDGVTPIDLTRYLRNAGDPVNESASFICQFRAQRGSFNPITNPVLATGVVTFQGTQYTADWATNAALGKINLYVNGDDIDQDVWPARGWWDVYGVDIAGNATRLIWGSWRVRDTATDA